ncbi:MAG: 50S ribosomal protein L6 [Candidatus Hinthialibacter antarcticus]|nr:50S ribosomal protein L6 [Candidatus Hinthialibacter antarcticus]
MSRIGRLPITVPSGVQVTIKDQAVSVKGPKGELKWDVPEPILVKQNDNELLVERPNDEGPVRALHGTTRALIANMVIGVSDGFTRVLEINGVGYRAAVKGTILNLELGYSHPIDYQLPKEVTAEVEKNTVVTLKSYNKQVLGQVAAEVRSMRPPEPYKGKGVKYAEEHIRRKVGKKNA